MDGHLAIGTAVVILVAKAHFALTTALYETLRSYRLLKKFKKLSSYAPNSNNNRFPLSNTYAIFSGSTFTY